MGAIHRNVGKYICQGKHVKHRGTMGLEKHKPDFLGHIGNGLENLLMAVDNVGGLETLSDLATECETILAREKYYDK